MAVAPLVMRSLVQIGMRDRGGVRPALLCRTVGAGRHGLGTHEGQREDDKDAERALGCHSWNHTQRVAPLWPM